MSQFLRTTFFMWFYSAFVWFYSKLFFIFCSCLLFGILYAVSKFVYSIFTKIFQTKFRLDRILQFGLTIIFMIISNFCTAPQNKVLGFIFINLHISLFSLENLHDISFDLCFSMLNLFFIFYFWGTMLIF